MKFERIPTHIPGFDTLIEGGLLRGCSYLVTGQAGSGKTTFAVEIMYNFAKYENKKGLLVSIEEPVERVKGFMSQFGWDIDSLEKKGQLFLIDFSPQKLFSPGTEIAEDFDLSGFNTILHEYIKQKDIDIVVIDSVPVLLSFIRDEVKMRNELLTLKTMLDIDNCITIFVSEIPEGMKGVSRTGIEEFIADGVIILKNLEYKFSRARGLEVFKMRGTNHVTGTRAMSITSKGIEVFGDLFVQ